MSECIAQGHNFITSYHETGGISLGIFLVRQGASNPLVQFLPNIPPTTVSGNPTKKNLKEDSESAFLVSANSQTL